MSVPFWTDDAGATDADPANKDRRTVWDKCVLGGVTLPGAAEVSVQQGRKIDDRGGPGRNGARLIDKGAEAGKVTIRLRVWTAGQLAELQRSLPSLNYREERTTRRLTFEERLRITQADPQYAAAQTSTAASADGAAGIFGGGAVFAAEGSVTRTRRSRAALDISHPMVVLAGITKVYVERIQYEPVRDGVLEVRFECLEYNSEVEQRSRTHAPRPRPNGDFVRRTAFDAPGSTQPASNTPASPPSQTASGPRR